MQILSLGGEETLPHLTLLLQIAFGLLSPSWQVSRTLGNSQLHLWDSPFPLCNLSLKKWSTPEHPHLPVPDSCPA